MKLHSTNKSFILLESKTENFLQPLRLRITHINTYGCLFCACTHPCVLEMIKLTEAPRLYDHHIHHQCEKE